MNNEIEIKCKASLIVDESTFKTCLSLIEMFAHNHGIKGYVLDFRDVDESPIRRWLMSDEAVDDVLRVETKYNK